MASSNDPTEIIRVAVLADAEAVMTLSSQARKRAYKELIPANRQADFAKAIQPSAESLLRWRKKIQKAIDNPAEHVALVMTVNGKVIGFYSAQVTGTQLHIKNLYIDPILQGRGLGKKLMNAGMHATPSKKTMLHVLAANKGAVEFYKRQGFTVVNEPTSPFYGAKRFTMVRQG